MREKFFAAVFGPASYRHFVLAGAQIGLIVRILQGIFTPSHSPNYQNYKRMQREQDAINYVNNNEEEKRYTDAILREGFMADYRSGADADLAQCGRLLLAAQVVVLLVNLLVFPTAGALYAVAQRLFAAISLAGFALAAVYTVRVHKNMQKVEEIALTGQEPDPSLARSLYIYRAGIKGREKIAYYCTVFATFACAIYVPYLYKAVLTAFMRVLSQCRF